MGLSVRPTIPTCVCKYCIICVDILYNDCIVLYCLVVVSVVVSSHR